MDGMDNRVNVRADKKKSILPLAAGYTAAIVSLVLYPFIFGVAGIILGILASRNGSRAGLSLVVASVVLMAAGMIFGTALFSDLIGFPGI